MVMGATVGAPPTQQLTFGRSSHLLSASRFVLARLPRVVLWRTNPHLAWGSLKDDGFGLFVFSRDVTIGLPGKTTGNLATADASWTPWHPKLGRRKTANARQTPR